VEHSELEALADDPDLAELAEVAVHTTDINIGKLNYNYIII